MFFQQRQNSGRVGVWAMSPMFTVCQEERRMRRLGFAAAMAEMKGSAAAERMKWRRFMVDCFMKTNRMKAPAMVSLRVRTCFNVVETTTSKACFF